eukprot:978983-Pyramimonas_sp.AAC.1
MPFSCKRAREAPRKEKEFFYWWRRTAANWPQGTEYPDELIEEVATYIGTAKWLYLKVSEKGKHDPGNYSYAWAKFASAV